MGVYWALKRSRGSFNWASAVGYAGMGLEPASGGEKAPNKPVFHLIRPWGLLAPPLALL